MRLAYNAIKSGQCESVIIGTANLALHSEFQWIYNQMGLLSSDGSTRPFDADASGYGRGDGVAIMYLQKASQARRVYATIEGISTIFNGNQPGGLLDIDVNNMTEFMEDFYKDTSVKPEDVEYVETYGCGLKEVDKKEVEALEKVYCKKRKSPLKIGSMKTVMGHAEASSSLLSVAAVVVAMENGMIPATLNYEKPNPEIKALVDGKVQVVTKNTPWKPTYAAVNAIGIDCCYGHLLLRANPKEKVQLPITLPPLLAVSTRTEDGVVKILELLKTKPRDPEYYRLIHEVFSKPIPGHLYRGYVTLGEEIKQESVYYEGKQRPVWFVYSGMGSQWNGMASDLMQLPIFADSINKSAAILKKKGVDLIKIITSEDKTIFDNILHCFVGIAAIQIALTDVIKALGIVPDGIIGHSVGELGCAYADGCMTAEQMILSAYCRGKASLDASLIPGMMAAVGLGYNQIKDKLPPTVEVACHNSGDSCTLSGPKEDLEKFVAQLTGQGIFARLVNVAGIAYHSQYIRPAAPLLLQYLKEVLPKPIERSSKWISTSNREENWNTDLAKHSSAEYHTNNLLSSVLFEEGSKHIPKDAILIEIAPHGLLQAILKRSVKTATNIPLTQRGNKKGLEFLLQAFGKMYLTGMNFEIDNLYPKIEYPVSRGTPTLSDLAQWNHTELWRTAETSHHAQHGVRDSDVSLNDEEFRVIVGHQLYDTVILPTSYYLNFVFQIFDQLVAGRTDFVLENLHFRRPVSVPKYGSVPMHTMVQRGSGEFEVLSKGEVLVSGKMTFPMSDDKFLLDPGTIEIGTGNVQLSQIDIYSEFQHRGHKYSGVFKKIKGLTMCEEGSIAIVEQQDKWVPLLESMLQQYLLNAGERTQQVHVIKTIQKIAVSMEHIPAEKTDVKVQYEYYTNLLSTDGLQVMGIKSIPLDPPSERLNMCAMEYLPLNNSQFEKIERGIELALQMSMQEFNTANEDVIKSLFITEYKALSNASLETEVRNVINTNVLLKANLTTVTETKEITIQQIYPQLIIVNGTAPEDVYALIAKSPAYLLSKTDKNALAHPDVIQVAQFTVGNDSYSIFKKTNTLPAKMIQVQGDTLSLNDMKRSSCPWATELFTAAKESAQKQHPVFLIANQIPMEGYRNFVQEVKAQPNTEHVKFVFNLDKKQYDLQQVVKQNMTVSVIKDGVLYAYFPLSLKFKTLVDLKHTSTNVLRNKTIKYLSVNLKDETLNPAKVKKNYVGNIDYSAVTSSGERVMGLAYLDENSSQLVDDPIFQWTVPERCSLEDAATLPHAYVSAYYMLVTKANVQPGETVLIHGGCTPIGLAVISIAHVMGCEVYTTVATDLQRAILRQRYSFLSDHNILSCTDNTFEERFMSSTQGRGAQVILNCISGNLLTSTLACIAEWGRFIHYGKYDLEEGNSIGMFCFLKNTTFETVNLENVFHQPKEVKEEIKKLVYKGLDSWFVRPGPNEVVEHFNVAGMLSEMKDVSNINKIVIKVGEYLKPSRLNVNQPNKFACSAKSCYVVYGGTAETWTDLVEWLVFHGARKIVVSSDAKPQVNSLNRRLSLLQSYYQADIIMAPSKSHTKEGFQELLSEVYQLGHVHALFVLPGKSNTKVSEIKPIQYLEHALRTTAPKAIFVNFVITASGICHQRSAAGFATYNMQYTKSTEVADCIQALDNIMDTKVSDVLVRKDKDADSRQQDGQTQHIDFRKFLPTPEHLIYAQKRAPQEPEWTQVITEGPMEIRELLPLFVIPGLTGREELEKMFESILYPTFLAQLPEKPYPLKKMAEKFVEVICMPTIRSESIVIGAAKRS
ncbi:unnamed protein product [Acanthoscelides obtectus]|uniref:Uncharacterized protein n=1 Tax=Acanthoscelides obtectus TaxID=200917 RepID=A0A9P0Q3E5_ACAOB|nr:unnamed protein product [Acanthoscelides obtectus]CAK1668549.1 Fatty acid synthase [Acanthoscelides obtectus]